MAWNVIPVGTFYKIQDDDADALRSPGGNVITLPTEFLAQLIKNYVNEFGESLENGLSPYGLESSYMDFEFRERESEIRSVLLEDLERDPVLFAQKNVLLPILVTRCGFRPDLSYFRSRCEEASARTLCVLTTFTANFRSPSLAIHVFLDGKPVADDIFRQLCGIYENASSIFLSELRDAAIEGAFVSDEFPVAVAPHRRYVEMCRACCAGRAFLNDWCSIKQTIGWAGMYASLAEPTRVAREISSEDAVEIASVVAKANRRDKGSLTASRNFDIHAVDVAKALSKPYGMPDEPAWLVYVPHYDGMDGRMLRSSRVIAVSKVDGRVLLDGELSDEG